MGIVFSNGTIPAYNHYLGANQGNQWDHPVLLHNPPAIFATVNTQAFVEQFLKHHANTIKLDGIPLEGYLESNNHTVFILKGFHQSLLNDAVGEAHLTVGVERFIWHIDVIWGNGGIKKMEFLEQRKGKKEALMDGDGFEAAVGKKAKKKLFYNK